MSNRYFNPCDFPFYRRSFKATEYHIGMLKYTYNHLEIPLNWTIKTKENYGESFAITGRLAVCSQL